MGLYQLLITPFMKKLYLLILSCSLFCLSSIEAQQEPTYAFYKHHFNLINPAVVGTQGGSYVNLSLRNQWVGIDEAPRTQAVSFGTPHKNNRLGLGFSVVNDKVSVEQQTYFAVDFSYKLPAGEGRNIYLGLKAGGNSYRLNLSNARAFGAGGEIQDPSFQNYSRFLPNIGVGAYYQVPKGFVSISIPRLLNSTRAKEDDGQSTTASDRPHFFLSAGLQFAINENVVFVPSFLLSVVQGAPALATLDGSFNFNEKFETGIQYTSSRGLGGTALLQLGTGFKVGYAYTTPLASGGNNIRNATHEIILKIRLGKATILETQPEENQESTQEN